MYIPYPLADQRYDSECHFAWPAWWIEFASCFKLKFFHRLRMWSVVHDPSRNFLRRISFLVGEERVLESPRGRNFCPGGVCVFYWVLYISQSIYICRTQQSLWALPALRLRLWRKRSNLKTRRTVRCCWAATVIGGDGKASEINVTTLLNGDVLNRVINHKIWLTINDRGFSQPFPVVLKF